jgi:nucleotide-binding universal stress UspA family protein
VNLQKILCPLGHEQNTRAVLEAAMKAARESKAALYLIHVLPFPTYLIYGADAVLRADLANAEGGLQKLAAQVPAGIERATIVTFGDAPREIAAAARRIGAGLIVMGTHGRGAVSRFFRGNIAERVLEVSPCPVLMVPADAIEERSEPSSEAA